MIRAFRSGGRRACAAGIAALAASALLAGCATASLPPAPKNFLRDPAVTVVVTGFQGSYHQQVRVIGEAAKPAALPNRTGRTLLDAMIQVGGLTDFANGNSAVHEGS